MLSGAVVEDLGVIEDRGASLGPGGQAMSVDELVFEGAPEGFHDGVVVAVGFATHRGRYVVVGQHGAVSGASVMEARVEWWRSPAAGRCCSRTIPMAEIGNVVSRELPIAKPTSLRLHRSKTLAT